MAGPEPELAIPVSEERELVAYLESGCRPAVDWRIGTEHEKFGFRLGDLAPLPYQGRDGIRAVLEALGRFGWSPKDERGHVIAALRDDQAVTLEPGGQLELSGAPLETLHQTCDEVHDHLDQLKVIGTEFAIAFLGVGFNPKWGRADIPVMPKGRYEIMSRYMPTRGRLGLDMMFRTCTAQVNLDFADEADMVTKFRVGLALQPVATALFANSPFAEGRPNGYLSYRSQIWTDTDPDRCGDLPFVFEDGMCFERYADYVLDVPMYFVARDGVYIDASGQSFRDFLAGRLAALPGEMPTLQDWEIHLTTVFPEVRLKRYMEMRGADSGPWRRLCALPALWTGLLYDSTALAAAWDLAKDWTAEERAHLRAEVPRTALQTRIRNHSVMDIAAEVVAIADHGLKARARRDRFGDDEVHFLDPLKTTLDCGKTPAEELLEKYHGRWRESIDPLFTEHAY